MTDNYKIAMTEITDFGTKLEQALNDYTVAMAEDQPGSKPACVETRETLEPGLRLAVELLQREMQGELSAIEAADAQDQHVAVRAHARRLVSCKFAIEFLQEQMERLKGGMLC